MPASASARRVVVAASVCAIASLSAAVRGEIHSEFELQPIMKGVHVLDAPRVMPNGAVLLATVDADFDIGWAVTAPFNLNAGDTTNSDIIRNPAGKNLRGQGQIIGMWEVNRPRTTHQEFGGVFPNGDGDMVPPVDDHATHVAGTLAGLGIDANAQGMAPAAVVRSYTATNDAAELTAAAGLTASNHSYGQIRGWSRRDFGAGGGNLGFERTWFGDRTLGTEDRDFGKYDAIAVGIDTALYTNKRLLSVWAAGNDRNEDANSYPTVVAGRYAAYFSDGSDGPGGNGPGFYRVTAAAFPLPPRDGNGGTGYDSLPQAQTAKNSLVVGAIDDLTAEGAGRVGVMSAFSSWGPTDDGRMKPDIVGNGVGVYSATSTNNASYDSFNGTSMASPNVAGTMTQVIQHLKATRNTAQQPLSATSKGLAIHTAHDLFTPGPDYRSGYGVLDGEAAVNFIDGTVANNPSDFIIEGSFTEPFDPGEGYDREFKSLGGVIKATLVWNDAAGAAHGVDLDENTSVLVNDLTLFIGDLQFGLYESWHLDPNDPAAAATKIGNHLDNVEQVLIDAGQIPAGTLFTVHVLPDILGTSQDWTLLVSGAQIPEPTTLAALAAMGLVLRRRR